MFLDEEDIPQNEEKIPKENKDASQHEEKG
jgi:hypothetical protein